MVRTQRSRPGPGAQREGKATDRGDDFGLSAKSVSGGIFQMCCRLRGMEQFLMDMILNKSLARALMSRVEQIVLDLETALLEEIGPMSKWLRPRMTWERSMHR